jgi:predicted DNA-binding protein
MKEKCVTIIIPAEVDAAIERKAKVEGKLKRRIVQDALEAYIKK